MPEPSATSVQHQQELVYAAEHDYVAESPHLRHHRLHQSLLGLLRGAVDRVTERGLPPTVLEVGAGDGSFIEPLLARGCACAATEMSRASLAHLEATYGRNERFEAFFDPDGDLGALDGRRFSLVLYASVLHHIPDYEAALARAVTDHLSPGGALVSLQDPLWYPRLGRARHLASEAAFLAWRLGRGNLLRGVRTRLRRLRGAYRPDDPSDVVEYHVVRQGVDEEAIAALLDPAFGRVDVIPYWSTQAPAGQWVGERLGLVNTFAVVADERTEGPPGGTHGGRGTAH